MQFFALKAILLQVEGRLPPICLVNTVRASLPCRFLDRLVVTNSLSATSFFTCSGERMVKAGRRGTYGLPTSQSALGMGSNVKEIV